MRPEDFETLSRVVGQNSGIVLTPDKVYLVESRLMPVARKWKLATVTALAEQIRLRRDETMIRDVTEAMTTNESFFFRDTKPFDLLRNVMLPALIAARAPRRSLRIWSAAASSGQEAYSIAMILQERAAELDGWSIDILGTDLSTEMVDRAKLGIYSQFEVQRGMPAKLLVTYFKAAATGWQISESLRRMVRFQRFNLLHDTSAFGQFDIVFCRNVLIYFDLPTKGKVLAAIAQQTSPGGYLVLGGAETILGVTDRFRPVEGQPGLFAPAAGPSKR